MSTTQVGKAEAVPTRQGNLTSADTEPSNRTAPSSTNLYDLGAPANTSRLQTSVRGDRDAGQEATNSTGDEVFRPALASKWSDWTNLDTLSVSGHTTGKLEGIQRPALVSRWSDSSLPGLFDEQNHLGLSKRISSGSTKDEGTIVRPLLTSHWSEDGSVHDVTLASRRSLIPTRRASLEHSRPWDTTIGLANNSRPAVTPSDDIESTSMPSRTTTMGSNVSASTYTSLRAIKDGRSGNTGIASPFGSGHLYNMNPQQVSPSDSLLRSVISRNSTGRPAASDARMSPVGSTYALKDGIVGRRPRRAAAIRRVPGSRPRDDWSRCRQNENNPMPGGVSADETDGTLHNHEIQSFNDRSWVSALGRNSTAISTVTNATFATDRAVEDDRGDLSRHNTFAPSIVTSRLTQGSGDSSTRAVENGSNGDPPTPIAPSFSTHGTSTRAVENGGSSRAGSGDTADSAPRTSGSTNTHGASTRAVENGSSWGEISPRNSVFTTNAESSRRGTASPSGTYASYSTTGAVENGSTMGRPTHPAITKVPVVRPLPRPPTTAVPEAQAQTFLIDSPTGLASPDQDYLRRGSPLNFARKHFVLSEGTSRGSSLRAVENDGSLHAPSPAQRSYAPGIESRTHELQRAHSPERFADSATLSSLGTMLLSPMAGFDVAPDLGQAASVLHDQGGRPSATEDTTQNSHEPSSGEASTPATSPTSSSSHAYHRLPNQNRMPQDGRQPPPTFDPKGRSQTYLPFTVTTPNSGTGTQHRSSTLFNPPTFVDSPSQLTPASPSPQEVPKRPLLVSPTYSSAAGSTESGASSTRAIENGEEQFKSPTRLPSPPARSHIVFEEESKTWLPPIPDEGEDSASSRELPPLPAEAGDARTARDEDRCLGGSTEDDDLSTERGTDESGHSVRHISEPPLPNQERPVDALRAHRQLAQQNKLGKGRRLVRKLKAIGGIDDDGVYHCPVTGHIRA